MLDEVTRLDQASSEQWVQAMARHESAGPTNPQGVISLLRASADYPVFGIDNLTHCLQTAARAERAGASEEMVVAALLHDVAAPFALYNHAGVAAEILAPHVSADTVAIVRTHQDFQGRYYFQHFGGSTDEHLKYRHERWFDLAVIFSDEWDQCSFDPGYLTPPLAEYEPVIERVFASKLGTATELTV
jgi:predicted HD phosphohydrolase